MQLYFWNNPLVVSAMRLKYRRGSPGLFACLYILTLMGIGSLLYYNQGPGAPPLGRSFLIAILGIQFALSGLICLITVSISMNQEVNTRTFDFQRIVSLSPREILVGKMIGEPALSYFLAMATVPLAVLCWFQGGATFPAILLFYINLVTFSLMCASLGLLHTLAEPNQAPGKTRSGSIGSLFFMAFMFVPSMIVQGSGALSNPWVGTPLNLLTPIGSLIELFHGDPFDAQVGLWGLRLPSLLVAPIAQLAVTAWFVQAMSRRLKSPLQTVFGRRDVYLVLAVIDLVVAGVCFTQWRRGWVADELVAQFCVAHIVACLVLLLGATPSRTMLMAWLWRFRGQRSWSGDSLLFSQAEISLALAAMWGIGAAILLVGFVLPASLAAGSGAAPFDWGALGQMVLTTGVLIYALGIGCQWCQAIVGKSGIIAFVSVVVFLNLVPPLLAGLLDFSIQSSLSGDFEAASNFLYSLSPVAFFSSRVGNSWGYQLPSLLLVVAYLLTACFFHNSFRNWRDGNSKDITQKILEITTVSEPT